MKTVILRINNEDVFETTNMVFDIHQDLENEMSRQGIRACNWFVQTVANFCQEHNEGVDCGFDAYAIEIGWDFD